MRIKKITLKSQDILAQKSFFNKTLGFPIKGETALSFSVQIGWSELIFEKTEAVTPYHYCFLVPSNQLDAGVEWLSERLELIRIEGDRVIQFFESWNAHSAYFYDGDGNIAEIIARHDLKNTSDTPFSRDSLLCVNEIGMPNTQVRVFHDVLHRMMGSELWKGDLEYFGAHGNDEALILLPNSDHKKTWFPTEVPTAQSPVLTDLEVNNFNFRIQFKSSGLSCERLKP